MHNHWKFVDMLVIPFLSLLIRFAHEIASLSCRHRKDPKKTNIFFVTFYSLRS